MRTSLHHTLVTFAPHRLAMKNLEAPPAVVGESFKPNEPQRDTHESFEKGGTIEAKHVIESMTQGRLDRLGGDVQKANKISEKIATIATQKMGEFTSRLEALALKKLSPDPFVSSDVRKDSPQLDAIAALTKTEASGLAYREGGGAYRTTMIDHIEDYLRVNVANGTFTPEQASAVLERTFAASPYDAKGRLSIDRSLNDAKFVNPELRALHRSGQLGALKADMERAPAGIKLNTFTADKTAIDAKLADGVTYRITRADILAGAAMTSIGDARLLSTFEIQSAVYRAGKIYARMKNGCKGNFIILDATKVEEVKLTPPPPVEAPKPADAPLPAPEAAGCKPEELEAILKENNVSLRDYADTFIASYRAMLDGAHLPDENTAGEKYLPNQELKIDPKKLQAIDVVRDGVITQMLSRIDAARTSAGKEPLPAAEKARFTEGFKTMRLMYVDTRTVDTSGSARHSDGVMQRSNTMPDHAIDARPVAFSLTTYARGDQTYRDRDYSKVYAGKTSGDLIVMQMGDPTDGDVASAMEKNAPQKMRFTVNEDKGYRLLGDIDPTKNPDQRDAEMKLLEQAAARGEFSPNKKLNDKIYEAIKQMIDNADRMRHGQNGDENKEDPTKGLRYIDLECNELAQMTLPLVAMSAPASNGGDGSGSSGSSGAAGGGNGGASNGGESGGGNG